MGLITKLVGIAVAIYIMAYTVPGAVAVLMNGTGSQWHNLAATDAVFVLGATVAPIIILVVLALAFLRGGSGGS